MDLVLVSLNWVCTWGSSPDSIRNYLKLDIKDNIVLVHGLLILACTSLFSYVLNLKDYETIILATKHSSLDFDPFLSSPWRLSDNENQIQFVLLASNLPYL